MRDFDITRARLILGELLRSTRGQGPLLKLEGDSPALPAIRGVANRAGLFRFGLRLAFLAITARAHVHLDTLGAYSGDMPALIEFSLVDDSRPQEHRKQLPVRSQPRLLTFRGIIAAMTILTATMLLFCLLFLARTLSSRH